MSRNHELLLDENINIASIQRACRECRNDGLRPTRFDDMKLSLAEIFIWLVKSIDQAGICLMTVVVEKWIWRYILIKCNENEEQASLSFQRLFSINSYLPVVYTKMTIKLGHNGFSISYDRWRNKIRSGEKSLERSYAYSHRKHRENEILSKDREWVICWDEHKGRRRLYAQA